MVALSPDRVLQRDRNQERDDQRQRRGEDSRSTECALQSSNVERHGRGRCELLDRVVEGRDDRFARGFLLLVVKVSGITRSLDFDDALAGLVRVAEGDSARRLPVVVVRLCEMKGSAPTIQGAVSSRASLQLTDKDYQTGHKTGHDQTGRRARDRRVRQCEIRDRYFSVDLLAAQHPADKATRGTKDRAPESCVLRLPARHDRQSYRNDRGCQKNTSVSA